MTQPSLWRVLEPKWRTVLQRVREERSRGGSGKLLLLVAVGALFWLAVFRVLYVILRYFRGVEELGPLYEPKSVVFVDSLPWTSIGKIDKKAVREMLLAGQE